MRIFRRDIISFFFNFSLLYFIAGVASSILLQSWHTFQATPYIRLISGILVIVYFLPYFLNIKILLGNKIVLKRESGLIFLWLIFSFFAALVGAANQNPSLYIATDFIYILLGYCIFCVTNCKCLTSENRTQNSQVKSLKKITWILFFIFLVWIAFNWSEPKEILPEISLVAICLGFLFLRLREYKYLLLIYIPIIILLPNSNRALLVSISASFAIYILNRFRTKNQITNILMYITAFVIISIGMCSIYWLLVYLLPQDSRMIIGINQLAGVLQGSYDLSYEEMLSLAQRAIEIRIVIDAWLDSFWSFFFSTGLGSVINGELLIDSSVTDAALLGADNVHNVHVLPFALIHKYGVFGVVIFWFLLLDSLRSIKVLIKSNQNLLYNFSCLFCCLMFIYSIPASSNLWSSPLFWMCFAIKSRGEQGSQKS